MTLSHAVFPPPRFSICNFSPAPSPSFLLPLPFSPMVNDPSLWDKNRSQVQAGSSSPNCWPLQKLPGLNPAVLRRFKPTIYTHHTQRSPLNDSPPIFPSFSVLSCTMDHRHPLMSSIPTTMSPKPVGLIRKGLLMSLCALANDTPSISRIRPRISPGVEVCLGKGHGKTAMMTFWGTSYSSLSRLVAFSSYTFISTVLVWMTATQSLQPPPSTQLNMEYQCHSNRLYVIDNKTNLHT